MFDNIVGHPLEYTTANDNMIYGRLSTGLPGVFNFASPPIDGVPSVVVNADQLRSWHQGQLSGRQTANGSCGFMMNYDAMHLIQS